MGLEAELERKHALEKLLESPGWGILVGMLQAQADQMQTEILFTPCTSVDSALAQEYKKGHLRGVLSVSDLIVTELDVCTSKINQLRRNDDATGNGNSSNDGSNGNLGGGSAAP